MGKETITFGDIEVEKQIFYSHKNPISIYDVNIDKIVISNKVSLVKEVLNTLLVTKIVVGKREYSRRLQMRLPGDCKVFTFKCSVNVTIKKKNDQADAQSGPQVSREMLPVH